MSGSSATYIMTYRRVLKTSQDFYESLEKSRQLAQQLTKKLQSDGRTDAIVRSYSYPDVFYEQYLTMWRDTTKSLLLSIFAIFVVMYLFLGLDLYSATIIAFTIIMIIINLMGMMYWWEISLNAVSLVNLVVVSTLASLVLSVLCILSLSSLSLLFLSLSLHSLPYCLLSPCPTFQPFHFRTAWIIDDFERAGVFILLPHSLSFFLRKTLSLSLWPLCSLTSFQSY